MKKVLVRLRTSIKFIILLSIATFLVVGIVAFFYKPIYSVSIDGKQVGYSANKKDLQKKINEYIENGEEENIAFVQVENLPEYRLCLLKRGIVTNDEEIFEKVKQSGTQYYQYYAIVDDKKEKAYVSSFKEAENVVKELKKKKSNNIEDIYIQEKYETELKDFVTEEKAVSKLYEKKPEPKIEGVVQSVKVAGVKYASTGRVITSRNLSSKRASLGISLTRPISGTITSRFANQSSIRGGAHTGLDIAAPSGTKIKSAASGTVVYAGYNGSYGNMIAISHGNGVQTYYAHCSKLIAKKGQTVSQGQTIAKVGSTGNSTGPHLHLEVRINGVAYNPQNYVY